MGLPQKRMPTVMRPGDVFARVPGIGVDRSVFDRSHGYKTTFDSGLLVPFFVEYAMPGDTFDVRMTAIARLTTPIKPFMDNMYLDTFFFAVPFRLIWTNAPKFFGEQANPGDSIAYTIPTVPSPAAGYVLGSMADYMGLPTVGTPAITASYNSSSLPFRAVLKSYTDWFRDENLVNSPTIPLDDGPDTTAELFNNTTCFKRGKRHDYFTSCLPKIAKNTDGVYALVEDLFARSGGTQFSTPTFRNFAGTARGGVLEAATTADNPAVEVTSPTGTWTAADALYWDTPGLGVFIDTLRIAVATMQFLERDARGGTRYIEVIYNQFGVRSSDARLQRSEYLGGGSTPIIIAPVAQTTQAATPTFKDGLSNLGGVAAVMASGHGFSKSFEEHSVVLGFVNVRADLTYSQGKERFWDYSSRLDFPWPIFAHLSEQAVLNKEIYCTGAAADNLVFGYQERYAERRYKPSKVTNLFRPTAAGTLELWHLSEKFSTLPVLGQNFIEDQTESIMDTRVAVPAEPDWYLDAWFDFKMAAALPVHSVPGLKRL